MATPPTHTLGSANSVNNGAALMQSELLLLRIPIAAGEQLLQASTDAGSAPLTSSGSGPQHLAFVRSVNYHPNGFELEVYPVVSFSREGGAIDGYNATNDAIKPTLIPLPPLSHHFPTPQTFGPPLVIGGWEDSKDTWLHVVPKKFIMPRSRSFKRFNPLVVVSYEEMGQIDTYRNDLSAAPQEQGPSDSRPGGNGGTGDANGQGGEDDAGGEDDVGGGSGGRLRQLLCCGGQDRAADEARDDLSSDTSSTSDLESDDEDNFATVKDDLILLASTDPLFVPELEKYIEAEQAEQAERVVRVERWLQDVY